MSGMKIDPTTGLVHLIDLKTGKVVKLQPIDAREQIGLEAPTLRLASIEEAPQVDRSKPLIDWSVEKVQALREHCQRAGLSFEDKSKGQLVDILTKSDYIPADMVRKNG